MVNIYEQKLTNLQQSIIRLLSVKVGKSLNQNQIANYLDVSQAAVKKAIPYLEKNEYVLTDQDKETNRWEITLNTQNIKIKKLKRIENLRLIYESGLFYYLDEELAGSKIILFGSYSKGEDTILSDIDIAVIGRSHKKLDIEKYEKLLERKININFYKGEIDKHLKNNILSGIDL